MLLSRRFRPVLQASFGRLDTGCARYFAAKACPELRILFCGSDDFSSESLRALDKAKNAKTLPISAIEVVCRPPKPTGRGLTRLREVPISQTARSLSLPLHEKDTFTGWTPPETGNGPFNLIIAVSFGLKIPRRILQEAEYGGLNVHPSLLPDFHGPAPVYHTLLSGCTRTGMTIQTLHPTKFDQGKILLQRSLPIPRPDTIGAKDLTRLLARSSARLLVRGLREAVFVPPIQEVEKPLADSGSLRQERHAPKIMPEDRHIDWDGMPAWEIVRRSRIIGPLWSTATRATAEQPGEKKSVRIKWSKEWTFPEEDDPHRPHLNPGEVVLSKNQADDCIYVGTADGKSVCAASFTIPGRAELTANDAAAYGGLCKRDDPDNLWVKFHDRLF